MSAVFPLTSQVLVGSHITTIIIILMYYAKQNNAYSTTDSHLPNAMAIITACNAKRCALSEEIPFTLQMRFQLLYNTYISTHVTVYS